MTAHPHGSEPTVHEMARIAALYSMSRERCRAEKTVEVYQATVQPCRDMIRTRLERHQVAFADAVYELACEFDDRGEDHMLVWIYAAAADVLEEGL